MKTARTRDEILKAVEGAAQQLQSRLVPVTGGSEPDAEGEVHICRCERGGNPCPGCVEIPPQSHSANFPTAKETEVNKKWNT